MNLESIKLHTELFTDKGASQVATQRDASLSVVDPSATLTKKLNYEFGRDATGKLLETAEATGDIIGIAYLRKGADIMWHNVEILVDTDAEDFTCEIGLLDDDGVFTKKATMGTPSNFVGTATIPEPHSPILEETAWVVAKITGTPPTSGKASFYLPYIALA